MNTEYDFSTVNLDGSPCPLIITVRAKCLDDALLKAQDTLKDSLLVNVVRIDKTIIWEWQ